ncbi:MAG: hypothetical protein ACXVFV_13275, partial [Mycobacteriales bacterium]
PDAEREALLARVEDRVRQVLPAPLLGLEADEWDDEEEPHRRYSLSLMALGVVLAAALGIGIGVLASRGGGDSGVVTSSVPLVTAAPPFVLKDVGSPAPPEPPSSPRVFLITPSPTPAPTAAPTESPTPLPTASTGAPLTLQVSPSSGPNDSTLTVTGGGWTPGATVTVTYQAGLNGTAGSTVTATVSPDGTFATTLSAHDPSGVPGAHTVHADDGSQTADATFTAT